jgi:D-alanyl-lipoteichoic acid acyltransferase DltB (MBOAT superfamily)
MFLLLVLLATNPITSTELPEEALDEAVTFQQIFSLLALLILAQIVVVICIWGICLLARKAKEKSRLKITSWQDDLPSKDN